MVTSYHHYKAVHDCIYEWVLPNISCTQIFDMNICRMGFDSIFPVNLEMKQGKSSKFTCCAVDNAG
jgi:hypothetical protein